MFIIVKIIVHQNVVTAAQLIFLFYKKDNFLFEISLTFYLQRHLQRILRVRSLSLKEDLSCALKSKYLGD